MSIVELMVALGCAAMLACHQPEELKPGAAPAVTAFWGKTFRYRSEYTGPAVLGDRFWRASVSEICATDLQETCWDIKPPLQQPGRLVNREHWHPGSPIWLMSETSAIRSDGRNDPVVIPIPNHNINPNTDGDRLFWHEHVNGRDRSVSILDSSMTRPRKQAYAFPATGLAVEPSVVLAVTSELVVLEATDRTAKTYALVTVPLGAIDVPAAATVTPLNRPPVAEQGRVLIDLDGTHWRFISRDRTFDFTCSVAGSLPPTLLLSGDAAYLWTPSESLQRIMPGACLPVGEPAPVKVWPDGQGGLWVMSYRTVWHSETKSTYLTEPPLDGAAASERPVLWVVTPNHIMRFEIVGGAISRVSIPRRPMLLGLLGATISTTADGSVAWVQEAPRGVSRIVWDGTHLEGTAPAPMETRGYFRGAGQQHAWLELSFGWLRISDTTIWPRLVLTLGSARFDIRAPTHALTVTDADSLPSLDVELPKELIVQRSKGVSNEPAHVTLTAVLDGRSIGDTVFDLGEPPRQITWRTPDRRAPRGAAIEFQLRMFQPNVFEADAVWSDVTVLAPVIPWYEVSWLRGVALGLITLLLIGFAGLVVRNAPLVVRSLGFALGGVSLAAGQLGAIGSFDWLVFVAVLVGGMILAGFAGALSTSVLRTLGQSHPTRAITWAVCRLRATRRRMYQPYIGVVSTWVAGTEHQNGALANDDARLAVPYVVIPAPVQHGDQARQPDSKPVDTASAALARPPADRPDVLIVGPGGCGKTAMLREIVKRALDAHVRDPRNPLPVVIEPHGQIPSLIDAVWAQLARHLPSREIFEWARDAGDYLIVVDGMTERGWPASYYTELHQSPDTALIRVVAATRPDESCLAPFRTGERITIFPGPFKDFPGPFKDTTLGLFLTSCGVTALPEPLLRACRSGTTYLPLLVRLAVLALDSADDVVDLAALYRLAVLRLVGQDQDLYKTAARLARDSYWLRGQPSFAVDAAFAPPDNALTRLRRGLLVDIGTAGRELKFAHDSMQVFLAAQQLYTEDDWTIFFRAATDPSFGGPDPIETVADLSDMLRFAIGVFHPTPRVRATLISALDGWSRTHGDTLSRAAILSAAPEALRNHLESQQAPPSGISSGATLEEAAEFLRKHPSDLDTLAVFYCRIARRIPRPPDADIRQPSRLSGDESVEALPAAPHPPPV